MFSHRPWTWELGFLVVVRSLSVGCAAACGLWVAPLGADDLAYERDIRPILKAHCFDCHGEGEKLSGGLDLRLRRWMLKGGEEGPAIQPGKPDKSYIIEQITSHNGKPPAMPRNKDPLSGRDVTLIRKWIEQGGVKIGGELFSDAMGTPGQIENGYDLGTYEGMIKHNLNTIVNRLK